MEWARIAALQFLCQTAEGAISIPGCGEKRLQQVGTCSRCHWLS